MTTLGPPSVKQCPSTWSDRRCISIAGHIEPSHHDHEHEWSDADAATNGRATGADERLAAASAQVEAIRARVQKAQAEWFKDSHSSILQDLDELLAILKPGGTP